MEGGRVVVVENEVVVYDVHAQSDMEDVEHAVTMISESVEFGVMERLTKATRPAERIRECKVWCKFSAKTDHDPNHPWVSGIVAIPQVGLHGRDTKTPKATLGLQTSTDIDAHTRS